ncbi:MAG: ATP-binding protein [Acidobacteria bacterium]|jgi:ligand-binding sensor domain-containing protein/signal transduction histidine kinase|nr:ATP-binding protein [Acidobacteriota bacterium]
MMNLKVKVNRKILTGVVVFLFLSGSICIHGQVKQIRFNHLSIEDGLSQSTVNCILQDKKGVMWFGTKDGLNRYDGYNFLVYNNPEYNGGISDNDIWSICEDNSDFLWIGTNSGGVNRFDKKNGKFDHYYRNNGKLNHNEVRVIVEDSKGAIWSGTYGGGLYKYDREKDQFTLFPLDEAGSSANNNQKILTIYVDRSGILWIGTEDGLHVLDPEGKDLSLYMDFKRALRHYRVTTIFDDTDRDIWIGTRGGGLFKFNPTNNRFIKYQHQKNNPASLSSNEVSVAIKDRSGTIWIGTYDGGLNRFDREMSQFIHYKYNPGNPFGLSKNYITSIYEDRSETLWIGTKASGLNILPKNSILFSLYRFTGCPNPELSLNDIRAFYEDSSGILWVGTLEGGLIRFDRKTGDYIKYPFNPDDPDSLSCNFVRVIHEDRLGRMWVGTEGGGLNKFDRKTEQFTRYQFEEGKQNGLINNEVQAIYEDNDGNLWLGTSSGLEKLNPETGEFTHHQYDQKDKKKLSHDIVLSIYEAQPGLLWIGTRGGGVNKFDIDRNCFTRYQHTEGDSNSLSHNEVWCISKDRSGVLWMGTSYGLNKLIDEEKGQFKVYLEKDGLPNSVIYSILEDNQGNLWMGTNKGLVKFDLKKLTFKNYDCNDGLQSNEFNYGAFFKNKKGEMFFGGINGFNIFDPNEISEDNIVPPVIITNFLLGNQPVASQWKTPGSPLKNAIDETDSLTLTYKQSNVFSFEFAGMNYANPQKNQYKYKMEGWDKDWIETGAKNRRATYTNLPSGDYTFKVKGSNKDDVWNGQGAAVRLRILPPPWLTWWAYALYIIAAIVILFLIWAAWSKRFLKRKVEAQTQKLKDAQDHLIQSEKMASLGALLSGVAHELNNPAAVVKLNSEFFAKAWKDIVPILDHRAHNNIDFEIGGLRYKDSKEDIEKLIPGLLDGSNRIKVIIDDLKIFSRKEDASKMEEIDLQKVIRSSINLTQHIIKKSTHNFSFENGERLPFIHGNFQRLEQIFINLIQNACQALTDNTQGIFISAAHDEIGSQVVIKVKDEGIGIDEKDLKYITDPFFTTKRDTGGVGLGLSISLQIIQEHGGTMNFESRPGKGTTVFIQLPVLPEDEKKKFKRRTTNESGKLP